MSDFDRSVADRKARLLAELAIEKQLEQDAHKVLRDSIDSLTKILRDHLQTNRLEYQVVEVDDSDFKKPYHIHVRLIETATGIGYVRFEDAYIAFNPDWESPAGDYFDRVGSTDQDEFLDMIREALIDGLARYDLSEET